MWLIHEAQRVIDILHSFSSVHQVEAGDLLAGTRCGRLDVYKAILNESFTLNQKPG